MKYIVGVLLLVVAAVFAGNVKSLTKEELVKICSECAKLKNTPPAMVEKYRQGVFPDDEVTRQHVECIVEKMGIFDQKTGYNVEQIMALIQSQKPKDIPATLKADLEKCADKNEKKDKSNVWALRGFLCLIEIEFIKPVVGLTKPSAA